MLESGDIVKAKVNSIPFIYHYGIILVQGEVELVLHNTPKRGAVMDTLKDFLVSRTLINVSDSPLNYLSNESILYRFNKVCLKGYSLLNYNCEHFINCMLEERQKSKQLTGWLLPLGFLFLGIQVVK